MRTTRKRRSGSSDYDDDKTERRKKQKRDYATRRREQDKKLLVNLDTENRELTRQSSQQKRQIGQLKMWANYAKSYLNFLVAFSHQHGAPSAVQTAGQGPCSPDEGSSECLCSPGRISDGVCFPDRTASEGFCSPERSSEDGISLNDSEEDHCAAEDVSFYVDSTDLSICQGQETVLDFGNIVEPVGKDEISCAMASQSTFFQDLSSFVVSEECITHAQWVPEAQASRKCSYESVDSEGSVDAEGCFIF